ncbi:MAG: hypothetical protein K0S61_672 [Anaerocolumna sp.]|jgi:hypothetical protein|nr:hypothetical protein [Anaerocolumna sp.]
MYKVGDRLEVKTRLLTWDIPIETKIMTVSRVIKKPWQTYYEFHGHKGVHYPESRIIKKVD